MKPRAYDEPVNVLDTPPIHAAVSRYPFCTPGERALRKQLVVGDVRSAVRHRVAEEKHLVGAGAVPVGIGAEPDVVDVDDASANAPHRLVWLGPVSVQRILLVEDRGPEAVHAQP